MSTSAVHDILPDFKPLKASLERVGAEIIGVSRTWHDDKFVKRMIKKTYDPEHENTLIVTLFSLRSKRVQKLRVRYTPNIQRRVNQVIIAANLDLPIELEEDEQKPAKKASIQRFNRRGRSLVPADYEQL